MRRETYEELMLYLDIIESELNKVAEVVGTCNHEEFKAEEEAEQVSSLKKAA